MDGLGDFIELQGFYDYINHFISGAVLMLGVEILMSLFEHSPIKGVFQLTGLLSISEYVNEFLWNSCAISLFLLICFLLGIFVQELYSFLYARDHERGNICKRQFNCKVLKGFKRLVFKVNQYAYVSEIFEQTGPITNEKKRKKYKEYAKKLLAEKRLYNQLDSDDEVSYFFAYCVYYIQVRDKNKKTEKLRDIEGLSMSLSLVFSILWMASIISLLLILREQLCRSVIMVWLKKDAVCRNGQVILAIISSIICAILSVAFDYRAERTLKNRIRMTLALYEAEIDRVTGI